MPLIFVQGRIYPFQDIRTIATVWFFYQCEWIFHWWCFCWYGRILDRCCEGILDIWFNVIQPLELIQHMLKEFSFGRHWFSLDGCQWLTGWWLMLFVCWTNMSHAWTIDGRPITSDHHLWLIGNSRHGRVEPLWTQILIHYIDCIMGVSKICSGVMECNIHGFPAVDAMKLRIKFQSNWTNTNCTKTQFVYETFVLYWSYGEESYNTRLEQDWCASYVQAFQASHGEKFLWSFSGPSDIVALTRTDGQKD